MAEHVKLKNFMDSVWPQGISLGLGLGRVKGLVSTTATLIFFVFLLVAAAVLNWMDIPIMRSSPFGQTISTSRSSKIHHERIEYPLNCTSSVNSTLTCPDNYPTAFEPEESTAEACPDYFRWIHQDLKPWKSTGITQEVIESGIPSADFRFVVVNGTPYVERYRHSFQTRDVSSIWGILQLLRLYPGKVPDLDLLFNAGDETKVMKRDYEGPNATSPLPVFHYCGEKASLDIVFPDWSFWGWPEVNIMPWEDMLREIRKGRKRVKWGKREPYGYWKGNPWVSAARGELMKCNPSDKNDWKVRLFHQDWNKETGEGFKHSKLEDQCTYRYKIYIEGRTWSVSHKYILACDSMTLQVNPLFYDFFSRSLVPMKHFWPIRRKNKCRDLKFAVEWGNKHTSKVLYNLAINSVQSFGISNENYVYPLYYYSLQAKAIGKAGSKYIDEILAMKNVYGYMFHLLNEYSKLLKFKPTVPPKAERVCSETMACSENGLLKDYMVQSMVKSPSDKLPCALPPPFEPQDLQAFLDTNENITRQVQTWENEYWKKLNSKKQ